jgi:hypothetical protein
MSAPEPAVLPCGCRVDCDVIDGVNTLVITACAADCEYVRYALDEAATHGINASTIDAR